MIKTCVKYEKKKWWEKQTDGIFLISKASNEKCKLMKSLQIKKIKEITTFALKVWANGSKEANVR